MGPFQSCHSFKETWKENSKKWTEDGKPIGHLRNPSTVVTLEIQAGKLQGGQSSEGMKTCHRVEKKAAGPCFNSAARTEGPSRPVAPTQGHQALKEPGQ